MHLVVVGSVNKTAFATDLFTDFAKIRIFFVMVGANAENEERSTIRQRRQEG